MHLPKNIIMGIANLNLLPEKPFLSLLISNYIGFALTYPIWTVSRRIMSQSSDLGMISNEYKGIWHGLNQIFKQEGIRGLFKGFSGLTVVV